MENDLLKKSGEVEEGSLSLVQHLTAYIVIKELSSAKGYPTEKLCKHLKITRSAYYRWLNHPKSNSEIKNERISEEICKNRIHNIPIWDIAAFGMNLL